MLSALSVFGRAFRTPDLRTKMLFALGMIAIYRIGSFVPTPGIDYPAVQECIEAVEGDSLYALINLFSGGALLQLSIFALGIMPYITASKASANRSRLRRSGTRKTMVKASRNFMPVDSWF